MNKNNDRKKGIVPSNPSDEINDAYPNTENIEHSEEVTQESEEQDE